MRLRLKNEYAIKIEKKCLALATKKGKRAKRPVSGLRGR